MKSLRRSINLKCRDCIYDPLAGGTAAAQIEACQCTECPLWAGRPLRRARDRDRPSSGQETSETRVWQ